jgi:hypothetical protein
MRVGDLVQCGEETGIILKVTPYDSDDALAESCDWIEVMWSGLEDGHRAAEVEGVSKSDVDYWLKEGVWTKPRFEPVIL